MNTFKKIETRTFKNVPKATEDSNYWRKLEFPVTIKEYTSIDAIDCSPVEPYYIAVTTGAKIDVYHQQPAQVWRSLSRFKRLAYGAKFRHDGQLILAGSEDGEVKLFNHRQKQLLRIFKGHDGPTHRVDFVQGKPQIVSFSDDKKSILWDVGDEKQVCTLSGHKDFIRAGLVSPNSENLILSGSYDHTVKLWDTRTGTSVQCIDHGAPVESLVCYPSGGVFISAGGNEVRVWDSIAGKMLAKLSQHHKTITSLAFTNDNKRLMSGSLDRHVKIYDVSTYTVVHSLDFPAPVLCLGVAPKDTSLVVGMISGGSGLISFQHRKVDNLEKVSTSKRKKPNIVYEDNWMKPGDHVIKPNAKAILSKYDNHLRKYEHSKALDAVLVTFVIRNHPQITVNVMRELIKRKGLRAALSGRDSKGLARVMEFIKKNIRNPLYKHTLMDVTNVLIDLYGESLADDPTMVRQFRLLRAEVFTEMEVIHEHKSLMGVLQMFRAVSDKQGDTTSSNVELKSLCGEAGFQSTEKNRNAFPVDIVEVS